MDYNRRIPQWDVHRATRKEVVMQRTLVRAASVALAFLLSLTGAVALEQVEEGIYRLDFSRVDDLLTVRNHPDLAVLILEEKDRKAVSDAHMKVLRGWVEAGGILWVAGDGLESALPQGIVPFRLDRFDYVKSSTGKRGGELVVRGISPRLVIADHPLTAGINQLYLFARYRFDGTLRAEPLVTMTDTGGNTGMVLAALPVARGYVVLDGTAREGRLMFGRLPGFSPKRPNSLKQDAGWNAYDWPKLRINARDLARQALAREGDGEAVGAARGGGPAGAPFDPAAPGR
jgi:hypothetical protein